MEGIIMSYFSILRTAVSCAAALALLATGPASAQILSTTQQFGKSIFFDENLSINKNQACAACHGPAVGWTGPDGDINLAGGVYEGSIPGRFGARKPPSSGYATPSPIFHMDKHGLFVGGNFWDGRATGEKLGNPAADQAQGPFLNPVEQALPDSACVVYRVCNADYDVTFEDAWGAGVCDITWPGGVDITCETEGETVALSEDDRRKSDQAYDLIALSIADYEASMEVNAFSSKYDHTFGGTEYKAKLSRQEQKGSALFWGKGKCAKCHTFGGKRALFTDFTFDNLGIPRNPDNPVYDVHPDFVDLGLGGFLATRPEYAKYAAANNGKHKVPTVRNVGKGSCEAEPNNPECVPKAYGHNGYFKSLKQIVHFYNTRDVKPACQDSMTRAADAIAGHCWPAPEVAENVNTNELGDLGLTDEEEDAIVAFMMALSDGYQP